MRVMDQVTIDIWAWLFTTPAGLIVFILMLGFIILIASMVWFLFDTIWYRKESLMREEKRDRWYEMYFNELINDMRVNRDVRLRLVEVDVESARESVRLQRIINNAIAMRIGVETAERIEDLKSQSK